MAGHALAAMWKRGASRHAWSGSGLDMKCRYHHVAAKNGTRSPHIIQKSARKSWSQTSRPASEHNAMAGVWFIRWRGSARGRPIWHPTQRLRWTTTSNAAHMYTQPRRTGWAEVGPRHVMQDKGLVHTCGRTMRCMQHIRRLCTLQTHIYSEYNSVASSSPACGGFATWARR